MQDYSLHGKQVKDTYHRILQSTEEGLVLDGSGNTRSLSIQGTLSATTYYSGSTALEDVIKSLAVQGSITRVQPGTNVFTGGTVNFPTINVSALTVDSVVVSGETTVATLTATSIFINSQQIHGVVLSSNAPESTSVVWNRNTDYSTFIYDTPRGKWLSVAEEHITGSRNFDSVTTQFLRHYDGVLYNEAPFIAPYDITFTKMVIVAASTADTWFGIVTTGTSIEDNNVLSLGLSGNTYSAKTNINVSLLSGQSVYLAMSGSAINTPRVDLYFKQTGS